MLKYMQSTTVNERQIHGPGTPEANKQANSARRIRAVLSVNYRVESVIAQTLVD